MTHSKWRTLTTESDHHCLLALFTNVKFWPPQIKFSSPRFLYLWQLGSLSFFKFLSIKKTCWAVESTHQQRLPVGFNVYPNGLDTIHRQVRPFNGCDTIMNINCYSSSRPAYSVTTEWGVEIGEFKIIVRNIGRKPGLWKNKNVIVLKFYLY